MPRRGFQIGVPTTSTESTPMNTTGHRRLANGSLLRLDFEHGTYVGTLYSADLTVEQEFKAASIDEVSRRMRTWI
jgi:hypothetical protein